MAKSPVPSFERWISRASTAWRAPGEAEQIERDEGEGPIAGSGTALKDQAGPTVDGGMEHDRREHESHREREPGRRARRAAAESEHHRAERDAEDGGDERRRGQRPQERNAGLGREVAVVYIRRRRTPVAEGK